VRDHNGQALVYVYFEDEPGRRSAAKLLARGETRRIVANVGSRQPVVNAQARYNVCSTTTIDTVVG
jgi:hypothetical protein